MYTASKTAKKQSCVKLIEYQQKVYLLQYGHFMNVIKRFSYLFTHVFQTSPGNNFDKTFDIVSVFSVFEKSNIDIFLN